MAISTLFYLILFFGSGYIAEFYKEPELRHLTRVISLVFLINSIGVVQHTLLRKELQFKALNLISIFGVFVSAVISIIMAYSGFGVYSIVIQNISYAIVTNALFWYFSKWKPQLVFSRQSFKTLFGFGSKLLASSILDRIYTTIDTMIIGKVFSAAQLGYFTRAKATREIPVQNSTGILTSIVLPIFSKIDNPDDLRKYHIKFLTIISYTIFPIMVGLFVTAEPLTIVLFTKKWLPSVSMLQILCVSGISYPLSVILVQTILVDGRPGLFLRLDIVKKSIGVLGMVIGLFFGFYAFLWGVVISSMIGLTLNFIFAGKTIKVGIKTYAKVLFPSIAVSFAMGIVSYLAGYFLDFNLYLKLGVEVVVGVGFFIGVSWFLKIKDFIMLKDLVFQQLRRKKQ